MPSTPPPDGARIDACPNCVVNTEEAFDAYPTEGGYVATYRCTDCDHRWSTAWSGV